MIFERGATFTNGVIATLRSIEVEPTRTSYRSPWQNGVAERFVGHYNQDRTHLGLSKNSPFGRPIEHRPVGSNVVGLPRVGGLHHRYAWSKAA